MIYILIATREPGKVQLTKYDGNRNGGREISIEEKIDIEVFINLIDEYKIIDNTQYRHNFRIIPTIINIYNNRNDIFK